MACFEETDRKRFRYGLPAMLVATLLAAAPVFPAEGQEAPSSEGGKASAAAHHLLEDGRYLLTFPTRTTPKGVVAASAFAGGIVALVLLDDEIRAEVQERRTPALDRWERRIEPLGKLRVVVLGTALTYAGGRWFDDPYTAETGRALGEALVLTEFFNLAAKGFFGRKSPGPGARASDFFEGSSFFPSGHSAVALCWATVVAERYGRIAAWIAYPVAGLVGLSRLERDVHWASDVLAGAALGHVVARTVVRLRGERASRRFDLDVAPTSHGEGTVGLRLRIRWDG